MPSHRDGVNNRGLLFGELLQELGLVDAGQVGQAMQLQRVTGQRLGDALIVLGYLRRAQLMDALLRIVGTGGVAPVEIPRLGELLVRLGNVTPAQLKTALDQQARDHRKLGEILVEQKVCTHRDVHTAVSLQQRLLAGEEEPVDQQLAQLRHLLEAHAVAARPALADPSAPNEARLADIGRTLSLTLHDIRTPLSIISGYSKLMSSEDDPAVRMEQSRIIERQLDDLGTLLHATLAYARGEPQRLRRNVRLDLFARDVERRLQLLFSGTGVECLVQSSLTGTAELDEGLLKRAIENLADNAKDAMPAGGRFHVTLGCEGNLLVFRFVDDGHGIDPQTQATLFDAFTSFGKEDGVGLGLALVKQFADQHGGHVSVHSELGRGAEFELRFPLREGR